MVPGGLGRSSVGESRWVNCRFCEQTYVSSPGNRCSLCGKSGGLVEAQPEIPSPEAIAQRSWSISRGYGGAASLAGCFLVFVGVIVGAGIGLRSGTGSQPTREIGSQWA